MKKKTRTAKRNISRVKELSMDPEIRNDLQWVANHTDQDSNEYPNYRLMSFYDILSRFSFWLILFSWIKNLAIKSDFLLSSCSYFLLLQEDSDLSSTGLPTLESSHSDNRVK